MSDYLPRRDAQLLTWSANWLEVTGDTPENFGLSAPQIAAYQILHDNYADAYALSQGPKRGPVATQLKNTAKDNLVNGPGGIRQLVGIVQKFPGTTDAMRVELNITVPDSEPTVIPVPSTIPVVEFESIVGHRVNLKLHDDTHPGRRKPPFVTGALLFTYVGENPPNDINEWKYEGTTSQLKTHVNLPLTLQPGTRVYFTAMWVNAKLETGQASPAVSTQVNYGGLQQAA